MADAVVPGLLHMNLFINGVFQTLDAADKVLSAANESAALQLISRSFHLQSMNYLL